MSISPVSSSSSVRPDGRRKYDAAFRAEALRLAKESRSTAQAARALGVSSQLLYKWQQEVKRPSGAISTLTDSELAEFRRLQKANARLEQERDILKKALAIFSQPTP
jgi:transposase